LYYPEKNRSNEISDKLAFEGYQILKITPLGKPDVMIEAGKSTSFIHKLLTWQKGLPIRIIPNPRVYLGGSHRFS